MHFYLAKIVYRIVCGKGNHTPQFDEQLRLVHAASFEAAFVKARSIGKQEASSFYNAKQQLVEWQFINVPELYLVHADADGAEVHSVIREVDHPDRYLDLVHTKTHILHQKCMENISHIL